VIRSNGNGAAPSPRGTRIGGLVLAAGAGSRFGGAKQLALLDGRPLLEHALEAIAAAPVTRRVVVLGANAECVLRKVSLHGAEPVVCERWEEGQSALLACGLAALADCDAVVVTLGDQPQLKPEAITRVLAARGGGAAAVRATYDGERGHPVLLEHKLFERLRDVSGDHGARNLLLRVRTREVPCDDLGGGEDVDTVAQLHELGSGGSVA
jgi:molybdenum cofactor cytidylyltransferase